MNLESVPTDLEFRIVLAARYEYLELKGEEASRAAEAGAVRENVIWVE